MTWVYITITVFLLILITGLISSCTVVKTNYSDAKKIAATVYYYLPESVIKIRSTVKVAVIYNKADNTLTASSKIIEQSFVTTTEMIADTRNLLALNYIPNAMMSDEIKYGVNAKGLLETVSITTEDRTAAIITKIAEAPQTVLGVKSGAPRSINTVVKIKEFSADFVIKAATLSSKIKTIKWNIVLVNELGVDEPPTNLPADFNLTTKDITLPLPTLKELIGSPTTVQEPELEGILTRPLKNIELTIESANPGFDAALPTNVVIADATKLITIPVQRTAFVKRTNKVIIQDGVILSNEINKPSSVEGFISIPIDIAKAIVSIPGQLITFRIDNTKRLTELEKEKLSLEKSLQENQSFALTRELEVEKVKLDIEKGKLANEMERQKIKLELEKSLLEAQKNLLQTQKDLDELKKIIEELKKKS